MPGLPDSLLPVLPPLPEGRLALLFLSDAPAPSFLSVLPCVAPLPVPERGLPPDVPLPAGSQAPESVRVPASEVPLRAEVPAGRGLSTCTEVR